MNYIYINNSNFPSQLIKHITAVHCSYPSIKAKKKFFFPDNGNDKLSNHLVLRYQLVGCSHPLVNPLHWIKYLFHLFMYWNEGSVLLFHWVLLFLESQPSANYFFPLFTKKLLLSPNWSCALPLWNNFSVGWQGKSWFVKYVLSIKYAY